MAGKGPRAQGRVQVIPAEQGAAQAHRTLDELLRLSELDRGWDWASTAVVARQWDSLEVMRAVCRERGIEAQMAQEDFTAAWQLRETQALLGWIDAQEQGVTAEDALGHVNAMPSNRWTELLAEAMETMREETGSDRIPRAAAREWIAEWARENRRRQHALLLTTAHRAKGLEFDTWSSSTATGSTETRTSRGAAPALLCCHDPSSTHPHSDEHGQWEPLSQAPDRARVRPVPGPAAAYARP